MSYFLPMNKAEMAQHHWQQCDFVFIIGDAYVDHPSFAPAIISRVLERAGYKVGIISQPDWKNSKSVTVLGKIRRTANLSEADDTENITRCVREKLAEQGMLMRRTLRAFPYARLYSNDLLTRMKAQQRRLREEARAKKRELREELNRRE